MTNLPEIDDTVRKTQMEHITGKSRLSDVTKSLVQHTPFDGRGANLVRVEVGGTDISSF